MLETLKNIDREWLLYANSKHSPIWDEVMMSITDRFFWIPFYIAIIVFLIWKLKRQSIFAILFIALLALASDQISSGLLKPLVGRLRPCYEPGLAASLRVLKGCGGTYGFVSSHAANTFALAIFLILLFRRKYKWIYFFMPWAMLVSYSRVYLGVHYPGDILAGAAIGSILGIVFYFLYKAFITNPLISRQKSF